MQIGWAYSTATPRIALMESRKPVCWMRLSARLSQYESPDAMPMHSSSLHTRMRRNDGSRPIGRNSPPPFAALARYARWAFVPPMSARLK